MWWPLADQNKIIWRWSPICWRLVLWNLDKSVQSCLCSVNQNKQRLCRKHCIFNYKDDYSYKNSLAARFSSGKYQVVNAVFLYLIIYHLLSTQYLCGRYIHIVFRVPELSGYQEQIKNYQEILSLFEAVRVISTGKVRTDSRDWCQSKRYHPQRATFKGQLPILLMVGLRKDCLQGSFIWFCISHQSDHRDSFHSHLGILND